MTAEYINRASREAYAIPNGQICSFDLERVEGIPDFTDPTLQYITSQTYTIGIAAGLAHSMSNNNLEATQLLEQPYSAFIYLNTTDILRIEYLVPSDPLSAPRWHDDLKAGSKYYQELALQPWSQDIIVSAYLAQLSLKGQRIGGKFTHVIFLDMIKDTATQMVMSSNGIKIVPTIEDRHKPLLKTLYQYGIIPIAQNGKVIPYSLLT